MSLFLALYRNWVRRFEKRDAVCSAFPLGGIMTRRRLCTIGLYSGSIALFGLALASFVSIGDSKRLFDGLVPLEQPLTALGIRSSFLAAWSEPHEVIIVFPNHSGIAEVDAFVKHAKDFVGHYQDQPEFDMTWRVYEKGMLIGAGSGANGASGVSSGRQGSSGFSFGSFPVTEGRTYEVVVELGPRFAPLLRASPSVEVDVATAAPSVGLAFSESLSKPIALVFCGLGLIILAIALWCHHAGAGRPTERLS
jgi:hypothetical protein